MAILKILALLSIQLTFTSVFSSELSPSGFLCSLQSDVERENFTSYISSNGIEDPDGLIRIPGPINHHGVCIHDISIVGSFGVIMATGSSCKADAEKFISSLEKHLKLGGDKGRTKIDPIAKFELPNGERQKGSLVVYRGEPSIEAKHIATAKKISYFCVRQAGGTQ